MIESLALQVATDVTQYWIGAFTILACAWFIRQTIFT